jgi:hypothetical protein
MPSARTTVPLPAFCHGHSIHAQRAPTCQEIAPQSKNCSLLEGCGLFGADPARRVDCGYLFRGSSGCPPINPVARFVVRNQLLGRVHTSSRNKLSSDTTTRKAPCWVSMESTGATQLGPRRAGLYCLVVPRSVDGPRMYYKV